MEFSVKKTIGHNRIAAYGDGFVQINDIRHEKSVLVTPDRVWTKWPPESPDALSENHISFLKDLSLQVLLLGCGSQHRLFPVPFMAQFVSAEIGIEVMTTPAACRTYNILLSEERKVGAILFIDIAN